MTGTNRKPNSPAARPIRVEVIAPTFEGQGLCATCELVLSQAEMTQAPTQRGLEEMPPEWQADYHRLTDWLYDLADRYGQRVLIRVIDPQSPQGLLHSLRHWVRRYPTWLIEGGGRVVGWDRTALEEAIERAMEVRGV